MQKVDISIRDNQEIKREIAFAEPYLQKYRTPENLSKVRREQSEELDKIKTSLRREKETKENQLSLLCDNDDSGLLHWYIKNQPIVNEEQLQAILFYATRPVSEIFNPNNSSQYISHGCFTDISTKSNRTFLFFACPVNNIFFVSSSIAKATNTLLLAILIGV
nr:hypothetical protein [uncultured Draconibacterium sp.]